MLMSALHAMRRADDLQSVGCHDGARATGIRERGSHMKWHDSSALPMVVSANSAHAHRCANRSWSMPQETAGKQNGTASRNGAAKAVDRIQVLGKQVHVVARSYLHNPRTTIG